MEFKKEVNKIVFLIFPVIIVSLFACSRFKKNSSHQDVSDSSIRSGERLAKKYCQSCHMFPEPSLLDAVSWSKGVLPNMGPRLGIFNLNWESYPSSLHDTNVSKGFYPSQPLLNEQEWRDIINYYSAVSPDSLAAQQRKVPILIKQDLFFISQPASFQPGSATCYIKVDTTTHPHTILLSDALTRKIYRYNEDLHPVDSFKSASAMVDIDFKDHEMTISDIGILKPNNGRFGKLQSIVTDVSGKMKLDSVFQIDALQRPVQSIEIDLNNDGLNDFLVCEFGFVTGALSWYQNEGRNKFSRHILRSEPGAIKAYVRDYNKDGLPDLFVLFAQGDEGIFLFTNKGNGHFDQKQVLRFPPSYGSSYFEMDDFNKDGYPDILYTCGDNADFSPVLKPYHGVYIFLNDGNYNFREKYFFPVNGCYKAMAGDFDGDGDLDIATIAFFADYEKQPEEGFVYLENEGDFQFNAYSFPQTEVGRWLTMDVGDIDENGNQSILLGNFSIESPNSKSKINWGIGPSFLVLKNIKSAKKPKFLSNQVK